MKKSDMKNVLIIAYHFPPARSAGIYRPVKFAKYFPDFGWRPVILSVKNPEVEVTDASLLKQLPSETPIYLAYSVELERIENWVFQRIYGKPQPSDNSVPILPQAPAEEPTAQRRESFLKRAILTPLRRFVHNVINTPDGKVGWIPFAVCKGLWVIWHEKIDVIFSTSPPESSHVIALILSYLTGKKLVVDFRDPWTTHDNRQNVAASAAWAPRVSKSRIRYERWLERRTLHRAGAIIHSGGGRADLVKAAFPMIPLEKHNVITNGYDEADFANRPAEKDPKQSKRLSLVSVGEIYTDSAIEHFLTAFEKVLKNPNGGQDISLTFVSESVEQWRQKLSNPPFAESVKVIGFRPHKEAVEWMVGADVLLLLLPKGTQVMQDKVIAGRTFEYMRSGRPILMIGWEGESSRILNASGLLRFIRFDDAEQVEKVILEFQRLKAEGRLDYTPNWEFIRQFDRRLQTGRLAGLMDSLVKS